MLENDAVLVIGTGHYYTAPVGTPYPTNLNAIPPLWVEIGHTSLESILSFASEGGDQTVLGTLQSPSLRSTRSPRSESFEILLQQWDEASLKLYYGSNAIQLPNGLLAAAATPLPTTCAFLAVFEDGPVRFPVYAPKVEIYRAGDLEFSDTNSFTGLPLKITPVSYGANAWTYAVGAVAAAA